jgi:hypothetical protein
VNPPFMFFCWLFVSILAMSVVLVGHLRKRPLIIAVAIIPLLAGVLGVIGVLITAAMSTSSQWVYKQAFEERPSRDVRILESRYRFSHDYVEIYLNFNTSQSDVEHLIAKIRSRKDWKEWNRSEKVPVEFLEVDSSEFSKTLDSDAPEWFRPLGSSPSIMLRASPCGIGYGSSEALLSYSEKEQMAYFYCRGID